MLNLRRSMMTRLMVLGAIAPLAACAANTDDGSSDGDGSDVAVSGLQVPPDQCPNDVDSFRLPTDQEKQDAVANHDTVDPDGIVPKDLLADALGFFDVNMDQFQNTNFITVVDFSKPSSKKRFFLIDMNSGAVEAHQVAHGSGSDPNNTGMAKIFGNKENSNMSSLGFFRTMDIYDGNHPHSLQIEGLSATDDQVCERHVIIHEAAYVHDDGSKTGRSNGCFALSQAVAHRIADQLVHGSMLYAGRSQL
jgi:hypothetical protein